MIIAGSDLKVIISIGLDIGTGSAQFSYQNKSVSGTVDATVVDSETGTVSYDFSPSQLAVTGSWSVWGIYTFENGKVVRTAAKVFTVYQEGTVQK